MKVQQTYTTEIPVAKYLHKRKMQDPDFTKSGLITKLLLKDMEEYYLAHPEEKQDA